MKKILLILVLIVGCSPAEDNSDIKYFQDKRTGICFAYTSWSSNMRTMTSVDCSKVEKYINN